MNRIPSSDLDRLGVVFDDDSLVSDAGLLVAGTVMSRLGLEQLVDDTVRMGGRAGGARPGRKVLSLVASMLVGGSHIDHADRLRAGSTRGVLPFGVMAPSTLGTFLLFVHVGSRPPTGQGPRKEPSDGSGPRREVPTAARSFWMWIPRSVRFLPGPSTAPLMGTPDSWDTIRFWRCGRTPERSSVPACGEVPPSGATPISLWRR